MSTTTKDVQRIRQVLFIVDKNRSYKFDVNQSTTIKGLKRMIIVAANLGKVGLKLFHKGKEYTDEDDLSLGTIFPDQQLTEFNISISTPVLDSESKIKLKLGDYCPYHSAKYLYFYCYDCSRSICSLCTTSIDHKMHNIIEKYDYLQNSRHLVDLLFKDLYSIISASKIDKKIDAEELKKRIQSVYFPDLHDMLRSIEYKLVGLVDELIETSETSFVNFQQNINSIKDNCAIGLDKVKETIKLDQMMMNEEIFLEFDRKFKEMEREKDKIKEDRKKYDELSESFKTVSDTVETIYREIWTYLDGQNKSSVYADVRRLNILNKAIGSVKKDDIIERMLSDVKVKTSGRKSVIERPAGSLVSRDASIDTKTRNLNNIFNYNREEEPTLIPLVSQTKTTSKEDAETILKNNSAFSGKIIMRCETGSKDIVFYEEETSQLTRKTVTFPSFSDIIEFLPYCSWLNIEKKLYITGGQNGPDTASSSALVYDILTDQIKVLPNMPHSRHSHSMVHFNKSLYVVGGFNNNTCEKFDMNTLKWTALSPMTVDERQNPVLFVYGNYLYAFFGYKLGSFLDSVERLKINALKAKWEIVPYKNPEKIDLKITGCGVVSPEDPFVYFFGGKGKDGKRRQAFKFDFSSITFANTDIVLEEGTYFQESPLYELRDNAFGQFDTETGDHFLKIQF